MRQPVNILHQSNELADIVNLTALAVADAQEIAPRRAEAAQEPRPVVESRT
jgi:hypothetical protein